MEAYYSYDFNEPEDGNRAPFVYSFNRHNAIVEVTDRLGLTFGFDYGIQQSAPKSGSYDPWWSPIAIARITISNKVSMDFRVEYYQDQHRVIIATGTQNGFKTSGISTNLDYKISDNAMWRIEVRNFRSKDQIFIKDSEVVRNNTFVTTALAIGF